jgi:polysaccharide biosynthesis PFTS motif protein
MMRSVLERLRARQGRQRVRQIMRGYRVLKASGRLGRLVEIRDAITNARIGACDSRASAFVFGAGVANAELAVRQYLLVRVIQPVWLYRSLLASIGSGGAPLTHPLPPEWRAVLLQQGFRIARVRSALAWNGYVTLLFAYGAVSAARSAWHSMRMVIRPRVVPHGRWVFFATLATGNLPQPQGGASHDIISWYQQWPGRVRETDALCHTVWRAADRSSLGVPVLAVASAISPLRTAGAVARFIGWTAAATLLAGLDLLRGRWWHALMFSEAQSAALARLSAPSALAREYLFHNSDSLYRPLWTYEASVKGSLITFYFYSTNNESFKRPEGYPIQSGSWQTMNWPRYLVWDQYQADFVRRAVGDGADIQVVGPVWFSAGVTDLPALRPGCVAVFDVQPHRPSKYQTLGLPLEFYTPRVANQFLRDIHEVVAERGGVMALKRKRHIGRVLHRSYAAVVDTLSRSEHCVVIDPDTSAARVIDGCAVVLSMPFTSTALLARDVGKPSAYYDPHGVIQRDDRAAHGIPVLAGVPELRQWLASAAAERIDRPEMAATTSMGIRG